MNNEYNQYTKCVFYLFNEDNKEIGKFKDYIDIKRNYGAIACLSEIASIASDISNESFIELKKDMPLKKLVKDVRFTFEIKNNKIVVKANIKHIRVSGTVFCEGLENNAYIWGILNKGTTAFTSVINSGSYFQSVIFPDRIVSVTTNDTISGKIQASGTSNVSVRVNESTAWLLVEILD